MLHWNWTFDFYETFRTHLSTRHCVYDFIGLIWNVGTATSLDYFDSFWYIPTDVITKDKSVFKCPSFLYTQSALLQYSTCMTKCKNGYIVQDIPIKDFMCTSKTLLSFFVCYLIYNYHHFIKSVNIVSFILEKLIRWSMVRNNWCTL
jgi:hypothetical protein